jgi:hypothetical protein
MEFESEQIPYSFLDFSVSPSFDELTQKICPDVLTSCVRFYAGISSVGCPGLPANERPTGSATIKASHPKVIGHSSMRLPDSL